MLVHLLQHAGVGALRCHRRARFFQPKATFCSQISGICAEAAGAGHLWKVALLVDQTQQVAGFHSQEVQDLLIVAERDAGPGDVFPPVLLLLLLEDVTHEELLQLLVSEVDEQLLEAARPRDVCSV